MLVLPSIAIASINDSDGDQIDDSLELRMERKVVLETEAYKVKVHSEFRNATRQNEWELQLSTDEGVKLELGFSTRISALKREIESELELYRLFEFADADGDGMLTAGEELQTIDLRSASFSMPSVTNITSQDGEKGYRLSAQLLNQAYALKVFADFFPKHALIDGAAVTPTEAKVTFTMSGFQYTRPNSQLALRLKMSSESEMGESQDPVGGESEVHIRSANATGFFSWSTDAKVDSVPKPVKSSVTTTLKGRFITLSYPRGTEIIHDPKLGVATTSAPSTDVDNDGVDDSLETAEERNELTETTAEYAKIHSEFRNATTQNEFEMKIASLEGIKLELGFSTEINAVKREIESELDFYKLVEFLDGNGDGLPQPGEEVQSIDLKAKTFTTPTITPMTSQDGEKGYRLETHLVNEAYTLQVTADVFPKYAKVDNALVKPTESKVTMAIKGFPYTGPNTQLALVAKMSSEKSIEERSGTTEKEVYIKSANATGFFSWAPEAKVDGVAKPVKSSVTNTLNGKIITIAYPRGAEIAHDPKLGVSVAATTVPGGTTQPTDPLDAIRSDISNLGSSIDDKTTSMSGEIDSLSKGVTSVSDDVTQMRQTVDGLSTIAYASTGTAIIAILAAVYVFFKK
jgi:hypothetical protein